MAFPASIEPLIEGTISQVAYLSAAANSNWAVVVGTIARITSVAASATIFAYSPHSSTSAE